MCTNVIKVPATVYFALDLNEHDYDCTPLAAGLINTTFLLRNNTGQSCSHHVLQKINQGIFKNPHVIAANIRIAGDYLRATHPDYLFPFPSKVATMSEDGSMWRLQPYISNTVTLSRAETLDQAYEAAKQFGKLGRLLAPLSTAGFGEAIPGFHNLLRYQASFADSIKHASVDRLEKAAELIAILDSFAQIVATFERIDALNEDYPIRIVHHDAALKNVLLERSTYAGLCVIDLDTLGPGRIISDIGDLVRTLVSPVDEEETNPHAISIRLPYFEAVLKGYLSEMGSILTIEEKKHLGYSGKFIVYMQAIRFLTDFLSGDVYYSVTHPLHNYDRARNQINLLQKLLEQQDSLEEIVSKVLLDLNCL